MEYSAVPLVKFPGISGLEFQLRAEKAISELQLLKQEASDPEDMRQRGDGSTWRSKVRTVLTSSLGEANDIVKKFDAVKYRLTMYSDATPRERFHEAFRSGVRTACGYIDAAIYELRLSIEAEEPVDQRFFDPGLWENVRNLVADEDWPKVASQAAIYLEHSIRTWSELEAKHGKDLFATAFGNDAELRLGARASEWEGWRALATGFAQAVGNVDRHRIQTRDDAKRYAIGVLGTASLVLTQTRFEHPALLAERPLNGDSGVSSGETST